jgi:hypothetical protein
MQTETILLSRPCEKGKFIDNKMTGLPSIDQSINQSIRPIGERWQPTRREPKET